MRATRKLIFCAAAAVAALCLTRPAAAVPEWNQVRRHVVEVGPEAHRLVIGFRATPSNVVVKTIRRASRAQVFKLAVAQTSDADVAALAGRVRIAMAGSRRIAPNMHVMFLQKTLYGADVEAALKALRADPAVQFADVDQRRYPHTIPNDPLFVPSSGANGQWFMLAPSSAPITLGGIATQDLSATDAVDAWTVTRGSSGTVIADIDTGVLFDHPDLLRAGFGGRLLPGYDFVGQDYDRTTGDALGTYLIANDGDGWDPDPSDPGDWINSTDQQNALFPSADCPTGDSSWHGTRVSGVLGALTNNGVGVAGMTWSGYLLPVRALGKCGGYDSDIIAGMQWAVGMSVEGVPDNPYPADIVNLSLGGTGSCPSDYQTAFDSLNAMGVLVVVSAGNETGPVDAPANCSGVMAVAGLRNVGTKVGYSSFGPEVGISAPAGNCVVTSGDCYRSIDTTTNLGLTSPGANSYTNETNPNLGTSFSAPIVAGVAALMRAVNANLTPAQLIARLKSSASAFPPNNSGGSVPVCSSSVTADGPSGGECSCTTTECGAGMVNASAAVQAALAPIAAVVVPASVPAGSNAVFDGSGSAASCGRTVATYAWTSTGGVTITGGASSAQATVMPSGTAGTLTLTVTDSTGQTNAATVTFTSSGATTSAPSSAGTAASACPASLTVTPIPPTVAESFSPDSVAENSPSTLTITFNNGNAFALTQASFTEAVPSNLTIESSPAPTTTCSGVGTLSNTTSSVTMTGAYIPGNGSCSITLTVESATASTYGNTIAAHALSTGPAGSNAASASATLTVTAPSKSGGGGLGWLDLSLLGSVLLVTRRRWRPSA
jgi:serine protease